MNILDFHTHIFPDAIAKKATENVGNYYAIKMQGNGTCKELYQCLCSGPVTHAVVFSSATKAEQVPHINDYIAQTVKTYDRFIGFGTLHPDFQEIYQEIDRIQQLGLKGIKLHPDFQGFAIDDKRMYPVYAYLEGRLPVLFHTGDQKTAFSKPCQVRKILEDFPKLTVIAAHMGGYSEWEDSEKELCGKNVYFDTSSCLGLGLSSHELKSFAREHGIHKILFASDYPHMLPQNDYQNIRACGFSEEELQKILWENGARLLNI